MKAKDLDSIFDEGQQDLIGDLDLSTACRPNQLQQLVSIDMPE